jgi:hypothetical protein
MAGQVAPFRLARVGNDLRDGDPRGRIQLRAESSGKRRLHRAALEDRVLAVIWAPSGVRVVSALAMFSTNSSARARSAAIPDAPTDRAENRLMSCDPL